MWSGYMEEADEHDTRVSDGWKDGANGVLVFVSPNTPIPKVQKMTSSQDWPFIRHRGHIYHSKLSNVISKFG